MSKEQQRIAELEAALAEYAQTFGMTTEARRLLVTTYQENLPPSAVGEGSRQQAIEDRVSLGKVEDEVPEAGRAQPTTTGRTP